MKHDNSSQPPLRIGILHYHLLGGGVGTVMLNQVRSLIAGASGRRLDIDVFSGDAAGPNGDEFFRNVRHWAAQKHPGADFTLTPIQIASLGYHDHPAQHRGQFLAESGQLAESLLRALKLEHNCPANPYILHVHNANLGKNPRLTCAVKLLAERFEHENLPAWLLYQVHDLADDNRPACWQALRDCCGRADPEFACEIMYPTSSRILWACINSSDKNRLVSAGIAPRVVTLLPNAVDVEAFSAKPLTAMSPDELAELNLAATDFAADLKDCIASYAAAHGFCFEPMRKILLAPIKAIRRKNITESILLLMVLNRIADEFGLLITLPPNSAADLEYSGAIEAFVKDRRLPVVMNFGAELLDPGADRTISHGRVARFALIDLLSISEAVVTTSVQEGFGYVFHEPWLAGKMVLGRNIPRVTADFRAAGMRLDHLYDHLLIPKDFLADAGQKPFQPCHQQSPPGPRPTGPPRNWPAQIYQPTGSQMSALTVGGREFVDWTYLELGLQLLCLAELMDTPERLAQLLWTDAQLGPKDNWYPADTCGIIRGNRRVVGAHYDLSGATHRLHALMNLAGSGATGRGELCPGRHNGTGS